MNRSARSGRAIISAITRVVAEGGPEFRENVRLLGLPGHPVHFRLQVHRSEGHSPVGLQGVAHAHRVHGPFLQTGQGHTRFTGMFIPEIPPRRAMAPQDARHGLLVGGPLAQRERWPGGEGRYPRQKQDTAPQSRIRRRMAW